MKVLRGGRKILLAILFLIICGVVGFISFSYIYLSSMSTNSKKINVEASPASSNDSVNFVITGVDIGNNESKDVDNSGQRTDTILVAQYNPKDKSLKIISIPRDTKIKIDGKNAKINSAVPMGGAKYLVNAVQSMLGIKVNYYMQVDYAAFRSIIDAIGGVDVNITNKMDYDDPAQNLHIHFNPGKQHLNGQKAEEFFRWRKNNDGTGLAEGDLGRIKIQHDFMQAVMEKLKRKTTIFKLPGMLKAIAKNTQTNMSASEIIKYGKAALGLNKQNITMSTIKGTPMYIGGVSYFIYNPSESLQIFKGGTQTDKSSSVDIKNLKVEILNGTETNGLAKRYKEKLSSSGFANIETGNVAKKPVKQTKVTLYAVDESSALEIKSKLNVENVELVNNKSSKFDIIIILGEDFKE